MKYVLTPPKGSMKRTKIVKIENLPLEGSASDLFKFLAPHIEKYPECYIDYDINCYDEKVYFLCVRIEETDSDYKKRLQKEKREKEQLKLFAEYQERELYERLKKKFG